MTYLVTSERKGGYFTSHSIIPFYFIGLFAFVLLFTILFAKFMEPHFKGSTFFILFLANFLSLLTIVLSFEYYSSIARGEKPAGWLTGLFFGILTSPIGLLIYIGIRSSKISNNKLGYCTHCGKKISFDLKQCPFCLAVKKEAE